MIGCIKMEENEIKININKKLSDSELVVINEFEKYFLSYILVYDKSYIMGKVSMLFLLDYIDIDEYERLCYIIRTF